MTHQRGVTCKRCGADEWEYRFRARHGRPRSQWECAACHRQRGRNSYRAAAIPVRLWRNARRRAKAAGLPFSITVEDVMAVWPKDGRCPILGLELRPSKGGPSPASPSLDRICANQGYVPGNIRVVSFRANQLKGAATPAELLAVVSWILPC